jgi:kinesin family protein C2/C3
VFDLLGDHTNGTGGQREGSALDIRQEPDGNIIVPGLKQVKVDTIDDVISVFAKGSTHRATTATNLNEHSSRSHLIISIDVSIKTSIGNTTKGNLFLVDLAGSEKVKQSGVTGAAMREAQHINKSLSALGDVMEALDQKSKHIPYRYIIIFISNF